MCLNTAHGACCGGYLWADVIRGSEDVSRNAGPAPIIRDPVHPTIPYGLIPKASRDYPCARADSRANSHDGSELFIVDVWSLNKSRPVNPGDHEPAPGVLVTCEPKPCQLRLLFNQSSSCAATLLMTVCV
jgi:hypothetical protein